MTQIPRDNGVNAKARDLLKQLTPPLILNALRGSRSANQWRSYSDYEAALKDCAKFAYQGDDLVKVVVEKSLVFRERVTHERVLDLSSLRTLIGLSLSSNPAALAVIDFGGAGGYHYTIARAVLPPTTKIRWNIVETPAMVNEAKRITNNELKFFDNISDAANDIGRMDVVFTSGALQYCPAPLELLKQLLSLKAPNFFVTRTSLNNGPGRLITVQHSDLASNGPGPLPPGFSNARVSYPVVFESKTKFESLLHNHYDVRFGLREEENAYFCGGIPINMYGYFGTLKK